MVFNLLSRFVPTADDILNSWNICWWGFCLKLKNKGNGFFEKWFSATTTHKWKKIKIPRLNEYLQHKCMRAIIGKKCTKAMILVSFFDGWRGGGGKTRETCLLERAVMSWFLLPPLYLYYYIKKNLGNFKRWISFSARFEGCRPPRNANKGSMDRLFDVDGHGPKKSRILDQPDEKIQFEIFDKLSWPQLLTNFYEILTSCLPS